MQSFPPHDAHTCTTATIDPSLYPAFGPQDVSTFSAPTPHSPTYQLADAPISLQMPWPTLTQGPLETFSQGACQPCHAKFAPFAPSDNSDWLSTPPQSRALRMADSLWLASAILADKGRCDNKARALASEHVDKQEPTLRFSSTLQGSTCAAPNKTGLQAPALSARRQRKTDRKHKKKYTRTKAGCLTCRKRKIRCPQDGLPCSRCKDRGHECLYPPKPFVARSPEVITTSASPTPTLSGTVVDNQEPAAREAAPELEPMTPGPLTPALLTPGLLTPVPPLQALSLSPFGDGQDKDSLAVYDEVSSPPWPALPSPGSGSRQMRSLPSPCPAGYGTMQESSLGLDLAGTRGSCGAFSVDYAI